MNANYLLQSSDRTNVAYEEDMEKLNERRERIFEQQIANERKQNAYREFCVDSKKYLLTEAINSVLRKSLPTNDEYLLNFGRSIVESFVDEENASSLLTRFNTKSLFLSEMASIVESTHRKAIHGCCEKDDPFKIKYSDMKDFTDKINNLDTDDITKAVMNKVAKAEEEYVKCNIRDKEMMDDLAEKAQDRISKIVHKDDETELAMKEEQTAMYHQSVDRVINRPKGILESIVNRMMKRIITDDDTRIKFIKENGKINTSKIVEMSEVMYTFLETLNTTGIKNITPVYMTEVLNSIQ